MKTVDRLFSILEILTSNPGGLEVHRLADLADLPASTAHRFLADLQKHGYVEQDSLTKRYYLASKMIQLAARLIDNLDINRVSTPYLYKLSESIGLNSFLTIYDRRRKEAICIETAEGGGQFKFFVGLGKSLPLHCTASGKAIAAFLPIEEQDSLFANGILEKYTDCTLIDLEDIRQEWKLIRNKGYAICNEELEPGVAAIGAPIYGRRNAVIGSIAIVGAKQSVISPERDRLGRLVASVGISISLTLGAQKCIGQEREELQVIL